MEQVIEFLRTYHTPEELVILLEISTNELLDAFPDKVLEHMHKFKEDYDDR